MGGWRIEGQEIRRDGGHRGWMRKRDEGHTGGMGGGGGHP